MNKTRRRAVSGCLAVLVLLLSRSSALQGAGGGAEGAPEDPRSGEEVLLRRLGVTTLGDLPERASRIGREEIRAERAREEAATKRGASPRAAASRWTSLGPDEVFFRWGDGKGGKISGLIADVKVHPTDAQTIWIASAGGGVWKTTDGGRSWDATMDELGRIQVGALAVSPSHPKRVYAGSGCADRSTYRQDFPGLGLLVSDNGGEKGTWRTTASGSSQVGSAFYELDVDPSDKETVLAATKSGLFLSKDGGDSWIKKLDGEAQSLSRCRDKPLVVYATTLDGKGAPSLWWSDNGGKKWDPLPQDGLLAPEDERGRTEIAVAPTNPLRVYVHVGGRAGTATKGTTVDFAFSDNGGSSWKSTDPAEKGVNMLGTSGQLFTAMAVDPKDDRTVWVGGLDLWKTTDGGTNFVQKSDWRYPSSKTYPLPFVHADQHAYTFGPDGAPYFATDGGLFTTPDGGKSFTPVNKGLVILQPLFVCSSPHDPNVLLGGAQDNGPLLRSTDGTWTQTSTGDGCGCLVHPDDPDRLHLSTQYNNIVRSTDAGAKFYQSTSGLKVAGTTSGMFATILQRNPAADRKETVYTISSLALWVSRDDGRNWVTGKNLPTYLASMAVSSDGARISVCTSFGKVWETTDEGASWEEKGRLPGGGAPTSVQYDRTDSKVLWASTGTTTAKANRLFRSTDGGDTWTPILPEDPAGGLPDVPVLVVRQDPDDAAVWWAGTFIGLYRSGNEGKSWNRHGNGLPNVIVTDVDFYRPDRRVRIATLGRGFWEVPAAAPAPAPTAQILFPSEGTSLIEGALVRWIATGASAVPGGTVTYSWSWGDESPDGSGPTAPHAFDWQGTYVVRLTVTDSAGGSTTVERTVVVTEGTPVDGRPASLQNGAVQVDVDYRDSYTNVAGEAVARKQAETFAYFSFSDPANPEVFVKVLDFGPTRPYLLFWAGLTSFEYAVTFSLPASGKTVSFVVPAGSYKGGYSGDSLPRTSGGAALLSRDGTVTRLEGGMDRGAELSLLGELRQARHALLEGREEPLTVDPAAAASALLLSSGQVSVTLAWTDPRSGRAGDGIPLPQQDAFGYFHFGEAANPEVFVKALDFGSDKPYLLFWAGLTDFQYVVTFTNVKTGKSFSVTKPAGSFDGGADTTSLAH